MNIVFSKFNMGQEHDLTKPPQTLISLIPLTFTCEEQVGLVRLFNEEYDIYVYGRDLNEAYYQLHKKMFYLYEEIIGESDFNLSQKSIERKNKLKGILVKEDIAKDVIDDFVKGIASVQPIDSKVWVDLFNKSKESGW